jgi:hypothetical protein
VPKRIRLVMLGLLATTACGDTAANMPADSPTAPAAPRALAQVGGCPAGAKCLPVDENGRASASGQYVAQCSGRYPDYVDLVPANHTGRRFVLSQSFPTSVPETSKDGPWLKIDFKTDAGAVDYMMALRAYVYDGMIAADWRPEDNKVRRWYHVPWMTAGARPREFLRGMTQERSIFGPELSIKKGRMVQNWAVGFYNDVGALSIGAVWSPPLGPNPAAAQSAVGTVVSKILFSAATADDFEGPDLLEGAPAMEVNLIATPKPPIQKRIAQVRLLQMDVPARDPRAPDTGWVFGTFAYDRNAKGANGWEKMVPVGLMWGTDPGVLPSSGQKITESRINASAPAYALGHLGWGGRMNGPVDNPASSCLGCHATAQVPQVLESMIPYRECTDDQRLQWFRNLKGDIAFGGVARKSCAPEAAQKSVVALDYSLQQAVALNNVASGTFVNPCAAGQRAAIVTGGKPAPSQKVFAIER